jgi:hypothetical protein
MTLDEESRLCFGCVGGDPFLGALIAEDGERTECSFCARSKMTLSIEEIGDIVHGIFKKYAVRTDDTYDYWRPRETVFEQLSSILADWHPDTSWLNELLFRRSTSVDCFFTIAGRDTENSREPIRAAFVFRRQPHRYK